MNSNSDDRWKDFGADWKKEDFNKYKKGCIVYIKEIEKFKNWEICLGHWESFLTSDYWKDWQRKIRNFQRKEDLDFYVSRLSGLIDFIYESTIKGRVGKPDLDIKTVSRLISQKERSLQVISKEEWKKDKLNPFANTERFRELSSSEILNDPRFGFGNEENQGENSQDFSHSEPREDNSKKFDKLIVIGIFNIVLLVVVLLVVGWGIWFLINSKKKRNF